MYRILAHGHGTGSYTSGDRYFGNWKKGKVCLPPPLPPLYLFVLGLTKGIMQRDGFGVYYSKQGDCFFGNWRDDQVRPLSVRNSIYPHVERRKKKNFSPCWTLISSVCSLREWVCGFIKKAASTSAKLVRLPS